VLGGFLRHYKRVLLEAVRVKEAVRMLVDSIRGPEKSVLRLESG
jgi:hypothetical protein